jgi:hypothetical protein
VCGCGAGGAGSRAGAELRAGRGHPPAPGSPSASSRAHPWPRTGRLHPNRRRKRGSDERGDGGGSDNQPRVEGTRLGAQRPQKGSCPTSTSSPSLGPLRDRCSILALF